MATATFERLFGGTAHMKPKESCVSRAFDLRYASAIHLLFGVSGGKGQRKQVIWTVQFGPYAGENYAITHEGNFGSGVLALSLPVFAPRLLVRVTNKSDRNTELNGSIRIIRDLAP